MRVFGDRTWIRSGEVLTPSTPKPFVEMPLDLQHAYGGVATFDGMAMPFADNREGTGFFVEPAAAEGGALPNIEDPEALIRTWEDRPEPVGVGMCEPHFGPRARRGSVVEDDRVVGVRRSLYNVAFPRFVCPSPAPGEQVELRGMGPTRTFRLPATPPLATTRVGERSYVDPFRIDQIGVEPARRRFFVTYRYTFVYRLVVGDARSCIVEWDALRAQTLGASLIQVDHG